MERYHDLTSNPENNKIGCVTKDCKQQREWKGLQREKGMDSDRQMLFDKVRMGEAVRQDFRQAFPTERSFARPATQHLSSEKSEMTYFLTLCRTGNGSFLSASEAVWPYFISVSEDSQTESTWQRSGKAETSEVQE